jgi:hypothetical protein
MPRQTPTFSMAAMAALLAMAFAACSPAFNWREVRPDNTRLSLLLPCKPDKAQKTVPLGGQPTVLAMLGCDAGGATFAVAVADLGDAAKAAPVLAQWQSLTLANMKAAPAGAGTGPGVTQVVPFKLPGASAEPAPLLVSAQGQRADGTAVTGRAAYFAQGSQIFQVVMYAGTTKRDRGPQAAEAAETFFAGLKFE